MSQTIAAPKPDATASARASAKRRSRRRCCWTAWIVVAALVGGGSATGITVAVTNRCGRGAGTPLAAASAYLAAVRSPDVSQHELCVLSAAYLPMGGRHGVRALAAQTRSQWAPLGRIAHWGVGPDPAGSAAMIVAAYNRSGHEVGQFWTTCQRHSEPDSRAACNRWSVFDSAVVPSDKIWTGPVDLGSG